MKIILIIFKLEKMDNLNIYQNTFAPNSSSSTNFYTQKNFHPRQEAYLSNNNNYNNNLNQENSINNNNNQGMETVTSNKRTFKNNITLLLKIIFFQNI